MEDLRKDVLERFRMLLWRLSKQVTEDGRIPKAIKVVLRLFDSEKKTSYRETKEYNILSSLFKTSMGPEETDVMKVQLADGAQDKLLTIVMRLFDRMVDMSQPFHITLLGVSFSKFKEPEVVPGSSIAKILINKKAELEVQSITSMINTGCEKSPTADESDFYSSPTIFKPSYQLYRNKEPSSPVPMLLEDNYSEDNYSDFSDYSEPEIEPSQKKSRLAADVASPSKLGVCDLHLNPEDNEEDLPPTKTFCEGKTSPMIVKTK